MNLNTESLKNVCSKYNTSLEELKVVFNHSNWRDDVHNSFNKYLEKEKINIDELHKFVLQLCSISQQISSIPEPIEFQNAINNIVSSINNC